MTKKTKSSLPEKRANNKTGNKVAQHISTTSQFSGPLPIPSILEEYDRIVPGAAERILKMAEENSSHQQDIEKKIVAHTAREVKWGQIFGFLIGFIALVASTVLGMYGVTTVASIIGGTTVVGLVSVFVAGKILGKG